LAVSACLRVSLLPLRCGYASLGIGLYGLVALLR
jgi:hypothetical protein